MTIFITMLEVHAHLQQSVIVQLHKFCSKHFHISAADMCTKIKICTHLSWAVHRCLGVPMGLHLVPPLREHMRLASHDQTRSW
jgi:hypothetical protein